MVKYVDKPIKFRKMEKVFRGNRESRIVLLGEP
jgi:hypothetical protein